mmetsp:Transcript_23845/g.56300  ORF Transcript_23845/g.56300 Transcript_23845/m.56300 type:complete len:296 (+) Transcript_23845:1029-1916(+)
MDAKIDAISKQSAKIVDALSDLVGDVPWKEDLLHFTLEPLSWKAKTLRATFKCRIVDEILEPIMKAPVTKGTATDLQAAAKELCSVFRSVSFKPLLRLEFLSTLKNDDPFKQLFSDQCQNFSLDMMYYVLTREDVKLLEEGRLFQGFCRLVHEEKFSVDDAVVAELKSSVETDNEVVVDDEEQEGDYLGMTETLKVLLAKIMWREKDYWKYSGSDDTALLGLSKHYRHCIEEFPTIYQAARDFLAHPKYRISREEVGRSRVSRHTILCDICDIHTLRTRKFKKISKAIRSHGYMH